MVTPTSGGGKCGGGGRALPAALLAGHGDGVGGGSFQTAELMLRRVSRNRDPQVRV